MGKWLKVAGLAAVALMVAASASGDSNTYNYQTQGSVNFNPKSGQVVDNTGAAIVNLNNAPQDYELISPAFLSSQFLHIPTTDGAQPSGTVTVDSSAAVDVGGYNRLALLVTYTLDDSASAVTIALQLRIGMNSGVDSNSVFTIPSQGAFATGTHTNFAADSVGSFASVLAQYAGSDQLAFPDEKVLVVPHKNGPRSFVVYLTDRNGQPITGPNLSARWRHLTTYRSAPSLVALSVSGRTETRARFRADLIGWR